MTEVAPMNPVTETAEQRSRDPVSPRMVVYRDLEASDAAAGALFGFSVAISGETVVISAIADDGAAGADQGSVYVFVPANQPPNCGGAFPSVSTIWPPNHDMVNVTIQGVTDPDGDPVTITIDQIKRVPSAEWRRT
jgi:hypothetical protein